MLRSALTTLALLLLTTTGAWAEPAPPEAVAAIQRVAASLGLPGTPYLVLTVDDEIVTAFPGIEFVDARVAVGHPGGAFVAWILWVRSAGNAFLPAGDYTNHTAPNSPEFGADFVGWTPVPTRTCGPIRPTPWCP